MRPPGNLMCLAVYAAKLKLGLLVASSLILGIY